MLDKYIELKKISPKLKKGLDDVRQGIPLAVFGVSLFAKCHFVSSIDAPVVYLLKDRQVS